ncbi:MAG: hypothetical protein GX621_14610 [Pirellulaceae bacterium]|nr:hypothetical protein [Pirellulaceae bacterium]
MDQVGIIGLLGQALQSLALTTVRRFQCLLEPLAPLLFRRRRDDQCLPPREPSLER